MKLFQFSCTLFVAALTILNSSCNNSGDEKKPDADTAATEKPAAVNTIVTTPENMVVVVHKVADFAKWKTVYEAHDSVRLANGLHSYVIGRGLMDTNMVLVAMKSDDLARAKALAKSDDLKKRMKEAGVTGAPSMYFNTTTWQDTANVGSIPRSMTMFTIKDWDTWLKNFNDGSQERMDNGIVVRTVGHDADDNKKVVLVTALTDTSKAFAYYKSDALKKRREAGGVTTEPQRFLFSIVKRY